MVLIQPWCKLSIVQEYNGATSPSVCAVNILTILPERVRIRDYPRLALEEHLGLVAGKTVKVGTILRHKCLQFVERAGLLERLSIQAQCGVGRVDPGASARGLLPSTQGTETGMGVVGCSRMYEAGVVDGLWRHAP